MKAKHNTPMIVGGAFVALLALAALAAGVALLWVHVARDSQGYLTSSAHRLHTPSRALVSDSFTVDSAVPRWVIDKVRVEAKAGRSLFVGVTRQRDLASYLRGVSHATVEDFEISPFRVTYSDHTGARVPEAPRSQRIWAASSATDLRWRLEKGHWAVVVMNADGSPGVDADVAVGAQVGPVLPTGIGLAVLGAALAALGGWLINKGSRGRTL
ncbi:MAG TPA: hypothetical protein VGJ25_14885 [Gaiellaceae bacterium]|jgi:hypothetical protein